METNYEHYKKILNTIKENGLSVSEYQAILSLMYNLEVMGFDTERLFDRIIKSVKRYYNDGYTNSEITHYVTNEIARF